MSTKKWYGLPDLERRHGQMTLGMSLRAHRESEAISQTEFAKKLKISKANLCDIEKGRKLVSLERAVKFAKVLQLPEEYYLILAVRDQLRAVKLNYDVFVRKAS